MPSSTGLTVESSRSAQRAGVQNRSGKPTVRRRNGGKSFYEEKRIEVLAQPDIGKTGDRKIGARCGVSECFVKRARLNAGIEMVKKPDQFTPEVLRLLPVWSDSKISRVFGIPKQTVWGKRKRLGLDPVLPPGRRKKHDPETHGCFDLSYPRSKELRDAINAIKQQEIAEKMGLDGDVAAYERIRHNRNYLWSCRLRRAPIHSDDSYRRWIRNMLGYRVDLLGAERRPV